MSHRLALARELVIEAEVALATRRSLRKNADVSDLREQLQLARERLEALERAEREEGMAYYADDPRGNNNDPGLAERRRISIVQRLRRAAKAALAAERERLAGERARTRQAAMALESREAVKRRRKEAARRRAIRQEEARREVGRQYYGDWLGRIGTSIKRTTMRAADAAAEMRIKRREKREDKKRRKKRAALGYIY